MSIRLRFTLLYNAILALTLTIFGLAVYSIQAQTTLDELEKDLMRSSEGLGGSILRSISDPGLNAQAPLYQELNPQPLPEKPPPVPFENFSNDQAFEKLPEREIVRVLDTTGSLVACNGLSDDQVWSLCRELSLSITGEAAKKHSPVIPSSMWPREKCPWTGSAAGSSS